MNRAGFQRKTGLKERLLAFAPDKKTDFVIKVYRYIENNRPTANLAILYVILVGHRGVQQNLDALSAIGA